VLEVSDPFGEASYELTAGQHVLFEHGSLREVVDHETTPCGCPDEKGISIADALIAPDVAAKHPFPLAISEGLAPEAAVPQAAPGEEHVQVSETMSYNGSGDAAAQNAANDAATSPAPAPHGLKHQVGRFFRWIFRRG
jgi:hypothetical protein